MLRHADLPEPYGPDPIVFGPRPWEGPEPCPGSRTHIITIRNDRGQRLAAQKRKP